MRGRAFVTALLVLTAACTGGGSSKTTFRPSVDSEECPSDIEIVLDGPHSCGYLTVLEDRARPDGPTIRLLFLRVQPPGGAVEPEPIASVGYEIAQSPDYGSIVGVAEGSSRELILLDQRGTGHSEPSLACPEVDDVASDLVAGPLSSNSIRDVFDDAVSACRARLTAAGAHPEAYTLAAAAQDLQDLRRALHVPSWNLISWGTASRLLLEYARRDPEGIRALVLGSPQFPELDPISEAAGDMTDALQALAETCSASTACRREYPDLQRAFSEATATLERSPISASVDGKTVVVDGGAFVRVVRYLLSDGGEQAWGSVPQVVYRALDGDVREIARQLADDPGLCTGYLPRCEAARSLGAYLSFTCADAPPSLSVENAYAGAFGEADPYLGACRSWGVEPGGDHPAPVTTEVPSLVLRGEYDAFSPLELVQQASANMLNVHIVLVPHLGHDVFGAEDCLRDERNAWLLHPQSEPDYSACVQTIPTPKFATT